MLIAFMSGYVMSCSTTYAFEMESCAYASRAIGRAYLSESRDIELQEFEQLDKVLPDVAIQHTQFIQLLMAHVRQPLTTISAATAHSIILQACAQLR